MDLSHMSVEQLRALQDQVQRELKQKENKGRSEALAQIHAIADAVGLPLAELVSAPSRGAVKHAALYRHPDDASLQWNGRGRQPQWVKDSLQSGKTLAMLKI